MADLPYCPVYFRDLLTDCLDLTGEEFGAYVRLLGVMWLSPSCSLPTDPPKLARAAQTSPQRFRSKVWPSISGLFIGAYEDQPGGHITQKRLRKEWDKVRAMSEAQAARRRGKGTKNANSYGNNRIKSDANPEAPKPLENKETGVTGENPGNNLNKGKGIKKDSVHNLFPSCDSSPYVEHSSEPASAASTPAPPPDQKFTPEKMVAIWNAQRLDPCPRVDKLSAKRRTKCRARIADTFPTPEAFAAAVRRMMASSFMRGRTGWIGDFDWIIANEDNPLKLREGKYDDKSKGPTHIGEYL
jgi:uncharacterized protein YdaU (DUF1376 family)